MSQEQLVMQDAELEFDEELETHEEEEVQEVGRGRRDDFR